MKRGKFLKWMLIFSAVAVAGIAAAWLFRNVNPNPAYAIGEKIDSFNGVWVYYNGPVGNVSGRNLSGDNYNIGLNYQCVEFVKRYYYVHLKHKMPDSYGHAKDFFDKNLPDSSANTKRGLIQYSNPGKSKPQVNDILVFEASPFNKYGHVAIISDVKPDAVQIIQQNPGPFAPSRVVFSLTHHEGKWKIENERVLGWLRKK